MKGTDNREETAVEEDLRYPIGRFLWNPEISADDVAGCIRDLEEAPARLREAVAGLGEAELDTPYRPGGWTVRQVVHHVADSHLNAFLRVKLALTEERPAIRTYDQNAWALLPDSTALDPEISLRLVDHLHARWVALLRLLPDSAFARVCIYPGAEERTLARVTATYAWHGRHHAAHITALRARQGW